MNRTTRVLTTNRETGKASGGRLAELSSNGKHLVFVTARAWDPADTNGVRDVYMLDIAAQEYTWVSVGLIGRAGDRPSSGPSVNHDGSVVVFGSRATNMVAKDTNARPDVFVRDLDQGTTRRISVTAAGEQIDKISGYGSVSADGNVATFTTVARAVPRDDNNHADVFVRRLATGKTVIASVGPHEESSNGRSGANDLSAHGRFVLFGSISTTFVPGYQSGGGPYLFVRDLARGTTRVVAVDQRGELANNSMDGPGAISSDGTMVVWATRASDLVTPRDPNTASDIYLRH